jgi:hypothetical protein
VNLHSAHEEFLVESRILLLETPGQQTKEMVERPQRNDTILGVVTAETIEFLAPHGGKSLVSAPCHPSTRPDSGGTSARHVPCGVRSSKFRGGGCDPPE